jgi:hypothetical protein
MRVPQRNPPGMGVTVAIGDNAAWPFSDDVSIENDHRTVSLVACCDRRISHPEGLGDEAPRVDMVGLNGGDRPEQTKRGRSRGDLKGLPACGC